MQGLLTTLRTTSGRAHGGLLGLADHDPLVHDLGPSRNIANWEEFLRSDPADIKSLRKYTRTGRPYGDEVFLATAEKITGRSLRRHFPGPKAKRS